MKGALEMIAVAVALGLTGFLIYRVATGKGVLNAFGGNGRAASVPKATAAPTLSAAGMRFLAGDSASLQRQYEMTVDLEDQEMGRILRGEPL